jgi:hypothetical protein
MYHKMKRMFRIGTLVLMLLTVWAAGCNTAKSTQMPTSLSALEAAPTMTPTPPVPFEIGQSSQLEEEYWGQPMPGLTLQPFAPEVFSVDGRFGFHLHSSLFFSPDGQEVYFTNQSMETFDVTPMLIKQESGAWCQPQETPLPSMPGVVTTSIFSPDWSRLYLYVDRALPGAGAPDQDVAGFWFLERTQAGWSEAKRIGSPANLDRDEGTVYFGADFEGGLGSYDIYRIRSINGRYTDPENLGDAINTSAEEQVSCVAPDESYLIFYRFDPTDQARSGLYLSFQLADSSWAEPIHLDSSLGLDFGFDASFSPDGEHLFLLDRGKGVYWISAEAIEALYRP